jgi:hypothetical protein
MTRPFRGTGYTIQDPTKAERLFEITSGTDGPEFPLDEEMIADLDGFPGEVPLDPYHWVDLLGASRRSRQNP